MRQLEDTRTLEAFQVGTLDYRCRDIGYGVEEDTVEAFWVGYVDPWGKLSFTVIDGPHEALYLFEDEVVGWFPYRDQPYTLPRIAP